MKPTKPTKPKDMLSVVIITKDTKELLQQLLRSIKNDGSLKHSLKETVIIDNASADGTGDMVRNGFPWTKYVRNDANMGFAASANQGINQTTGEYALLLNSDTILIEGEIAKMLRFMEESGDAGICGPQLVYPDMRPQRSYASIPSLLTEILPFLVPRSSFTASNTDNRSSIIDNRASGDLPDVEHRTLNVEPIPLSGIDVPSLIGAAIMIRRSLFRELSGFDEQFFFFLEETDLCVRAKKLSAISNQLSAPNFPPPDSGLPAFSNVEHRTLNVEHGSRPSRVVLLPDVKVIHLQGKTVGKNWVRGRIEYSISLYKFIRKHHSALYYRSFQTVRLLKSVIAVLVLSILPFLLINRGTRRRYIYYWTLFLWHLSGCQNTAGLRPAA